MRKRDFILLTLAHYLPVLCAVLCYRLGAGIWFLLILLQIGLITQDKRRCPARKHLAFVCGNLLLSTIVANDLSNWLYYTRVSSDNMTRWLGQTGPFVGAVFVLILSAVALANHSKTHQP